MTVATLDPAEREELGRMAGDLSSIANGRLDSLDWIAAARDSWEEAPVGLRRALRKFRRHSGRSGALLLRDLPVDAEIPNTPTVDGSVERYVTMRAAVLMLLAHGLGDPIAYRPEKSGAMVQNVVPVPGKEDIQANSGSVRLTFHTENAFHPHRPDFVLLLCVRPDHERVAELRTCCSRQVIPKLSEQARTALSVPEFRTEAPPSFGASSRSGEQHAVLSGDQEDPDLRIDETATKPMSRAAAAAVEELSGLFETSFNAIRLRTGELAVVDNRTTVHGRSAFMPRYDGRDRWLQRNFVVADLRRSRNRRAHDGHILES